LEEAGKVKHLIVLALLYNGPVQGRTRMMKLLFLAQDRAEKRGVRLGEDRFEFVPYRFGPWSYEVLLVLEDLQREGLVEEVVEETPRYGPRFRYFLTKRGREAAEQARRRLPRELVEELDRVYQEWAHKPLLELIAYIYQAYPNYAPT
jgi:uncharacterized protein YwgA